MLLWILALFFLICIYSLFLHPSIVIGESNDIDEEKISTLKRSERTIIKSTFYIDWDNISIYHYFFSVSSLFVLIKWKALKNWRSHNLTKILLVLSILLLLLLLLKRHLHLLLKYIFLSFDKLRISKKNIFLSLLMMIIEPILK